MIHQRCGSSHGTGLRIAIIQSRFNEPVTDALARACVEELRLLGVPGESIELIGVPGAVEIPLVARVLGERRLHHAIIALGAVIRGDTSHYDYVCKMAADGCLAASLATGVPVIFGVLTCETPLQALDRSGPGDDNKGREAARAAVEMANLLLGNYR